MKLSILICTVNGREAQFAELYAHLRAQGRYVDTKEGCVDKKAGVEILFKRDNKEISVGAKRQLLAKRANGLMGSYIDDDDWVPKTYTASILNAITKHPDLDSIGFLIDCSGTRGKTACASNRYDQWRDKWDGFDYVRTPYHKTPIRLEHILAIGFNDMRFAEDSDFSRRLKEKGLIKKEVFINAVMYHYRYKFENHNTKYGIKQQ